MGIIVSILQKRKTSYCKSNHPHSDFVPDMILSDWLILTHLILPVILWARFYDYLHFTHEKNETGWEWEYGEKRKGVWEERAVLGAFLEI